MRRLQGIIYVLCVFCCLSGCQKVDLEEGNDTPKVHSNDLLVSGIPTPPSVDTLLVNAIPDVCSLWNGHLVYAIESFDDNPPFTVCLLARNEFTDVFSANNADDPTQAANLTSQYAEEDITGWDIPTKQDAEYLHEEYLSTNERFAALNNLLKDYTAISAQERYLCDDAEKSFTFSNTSAPSKAGVKKQYLLRPVKTIVMYTDADDFKEQKEQSGNNGKDSTSVTPSPQNAYCYLWNGHIVVRCDSTASQKTLTLVSRKIFKTTKAEAQSIADAYEEEGLDGWDFPDEELAAYLRDTFGLTKEYINSDHEQETAYDCLMRNIELNGFVACTASSNNYLLCDGGNKKYALVEGTKITEAKDKPDYYLLLTKKIEIPND